MRKLTVLALLTVLTACSTSQGIGAGTDSYKESPCACLIIPQPNFSKG